MNPGTLVIRADANAAIGNGHVMRCLALAEAWQEAGGDVVFATCEIPDALERRLMAENFEAIRLGAEEAARDVSALVNLADGRKPAWVALDGEQFKADYVDTLKDHGHRVLLLDDFGGSRTSRADLILNSNPGIRRDAYASCVEEAQLLLGTKYLLLRREFRALQAKAEAAERAQRLLISFGGSDPDGLTERVLDAVGDSLDLEVTAVVGSSNPRVNSLRQQARPGVTVLVDPSNLPELMVESDLAVIVSGGTLWETLYCGCAVLSYSRNSLQRKVIAELAKQGAVRDLGSVADFSDEALLATVRELAGSRTARDRMRAAGQSVVELGGAARVVQRMLEADCIGK